MAQGEGFQKVFRPFVIHLVCQGHDLRYVSRRHQLTIHIRKHFVPNGEWTLHPTKIGVTLSLYEWKELKKTIPLFEEREPELRIPNV